MFVISAGRISQGLGPITKPKVLSQFVPFQNLCTRPESHFSKGPFVIDSVQRQVHVGHARDGDPRGGLRLPGPSRGGGGGAGHLEGPAAPPDRPPEIRLLVDRRRVHARRSVTVSAENCGMCAGRTQDSVMGQPRQRSLMLQIIDIRVSMSAPCVEAVQMLRDQGFVNPCIPCALWGQSVLRCNCLCSTVHTRGILF